MAPPIREDMLGRLRETMSELFDAGSPQAVYASLATGSRDVFDRASLVVAFDGHAQLEPVASTVPGTGTGLGEPTDVGGLPSVGLEDASVLSDAYRSGQTHTSDSAGEDPGFDGAVRGTVVAVPLGTHGVWALAESEHADRDEAGDVEAAELLAAAAAATLDRLERVETFRERVDEFDRKADRLDRLSDVLELLLVTGHRVRTAETRADLERSVCEELVRHDDVAFAWIGGLADGTVVPRASAGTGSGYLDVVDFSLAGDQDEPAVATARRRRQTVVEDVADDVHRGAWNREALVRGFQSAVSVPVQVDETRRAVLTVFGSVPSAFDDVRTRAVAEIGDAVASRLAAIRCEEALHADTVVELELDLSGGDDPLARVARTTGATVEYEGWIPTDDGHNLLLAVRDAPPDRIEDALEAYDVDSVTTLPVGDATLFELVSVTDRSLLFETFRDDGAIVTSMVADGSSTRVVVQLPAGTDLGAFVRSLEQEYNVTLRSHTERPRPVETRRTFLAMLTDRLTDRQLEVLHVAFRAGYYEWPRESSGEEVAGLLGITQPTFNRHMRTAERKLLALLFET